MLPNESINPSLNTISGVGYIKKKGSLHIVITHVTKRLLRIHKKNKGREEGRKEAREGGLE